jgi:hypothetical protein
MKEFISLFRKAIDKGVFIKIFWPFMLSFLSLLWTGRILMQVEFSVSSLLWYTLRYSLVFFIIWFWSYKAVMFIGDNKAVSTDYYAGTLIWPILIHGAFVEGIYERSFQAALGGAFYAGGVYFSGVLGGKLYYNGGFNPNHTFAKALQYTMITSAAALLYVVPYLRMSGSYGALGAMISVSVLIGALSGIYAMYAEEDYFFVNSFKDKRREEHPTYFGD